MLWLIKIGELTLKKGNRAYFERILKQCIKRRFAEIGAGITVNMRPGRVYIETDLNPQTVEKVLKTTPGIAAFCRAERAEKTMNAVFAASLTMARECLAAGIGSTFKFEVRRIDKSLKLDSYAWAGELGHLMLEALPELRVDVHNPAFIIRVELREWAYIYQQQQAGPGGLPIGTGGRAILLLSGGIDSPVAGYLMAKRGIKLTALHFHTPPYTSPESHRKVVDLASLLAPYCGGIKLLSLPFTDCQTLISRSVPKEATTLHTRACMIRIAEICAGYNGCGALISGESLGQVASQTMESIAFTNMAANLPVFRPLIGMDKEQIIRLAEQIDTYETSIRPWDDCCVLFSPPNPLTRPNAVEQRGVFLEIENLEETMEAAAANVECMRFDSHGKLID